MEDLGYFIEMCLGVTLFVMSLTISIIMYFSLDDAISGALTINNMHSDILISKDEEGLLKQDNVTYTSAEIFFIINDIHDYLNSSSETIDQYSPYRNMDNQALQLVLQNGYTYSFSKLQLTNGIDILRYLDSSKKYEVEYSYGYGDLERLNLTNHYIKAICLIEVN